MTRFPNPTARSSLPSPLKSPVATNAPDTGYVLPAGNVPSPLLIKIPNDCALQSKGAHRFETAKSGFPSPLKSPTAIATGSAPPRRVGNGFLKCAVALTQQHSDGGSFVRGRAEVRNHKVHVSVTVEVRRRDVVRKDSADRKFSCRQKASGKCAGHEQEYSGAN